MAAARASGRRAEHDLDGLARRLCHRFKRSLLLREALTHPSAADGPAHSYERLEFLGDRVLALIISDLLLERFPDEAEGALARRLSALVRRETLAKVALDLGLNDHLILARSEQEAGASANPGMLADACEAVIGALYLDGGLAAARNFVLPHWTPRLEAEQTPPQDAKTALQEWAQGRGLPLPDYQEVHRDGPPHEPVFTVEVSVIGQPPARGEGRSKRLAEQAAAARLLAKLDEGRA